MILKIKKNIQKKYNIHPWEWHFDNLKKLIIVPKTIEILRPHIKTNDKILDIGIGYGEIMKAIKENYSVKEYGIDYEQKKINKCKEIGIKNLKLGDAHALPYENNFFDVTLSCRTIHVLNVKRAINEMERVTKKGGKIIICFSNQRCFSNLFQWLGYRFFKKGERRKNLEKMGISKVDTQTLLNYSKSLKLVAIENINYINFYPIFVKFTGIMLPPKPFDYLTLIVSKFLKNQKKSAVNCVILKKE